MDSARFHREAGQRRRDPRCTRRTRGYHRRRAGFFNRRFSMGKTMQIDRAELADALSRRVEQDERGTFFERSWTVVHFARTFFGLLIAWVVYQASV